MPKGIRTSGAQLKRLNHLGIIISLSLRKVAEELCCDTQAKACMYRECLSRTSLSHTPQVLVHQYVVVPVAHEKRRLWKSKGRRKRVWQKRLNRCEGSPEHLLEDFGREMKAKVCNHLFNIPHQYTQLQFMHRSLKEDEAILHIDYAENWQCKYAKEVHQVHFGASDRQTTLHNAVVYTTDCTLTFCPL